MASKDPWKEWIPGVLSSDQLRSLILNDKIRRDGKNDITIDEEPSIDLTLSDEAYILKNGSVKPMGRNYLIGLKKNRLVEEHLANEDGIFLLKKRNTYLFKLRESLNIDQKSPIHGRATARSTIGRVDVLARLIVDGAKGYEEFSDQDLAQSGDMFLEITPMTFNVEVKKGTALSQLRLFIGKPEDCQCHSTDLFHAVMTKGDIGDDISGYLTVNLQNCKLPYNTNDGKESYVKDSNSNEIEVAAFCAIEGDDTRPPIRLWDNNAHDPTQYWRMIKTEADNENNHRLQITENNFYILRSKELIGLPEGIAVYCRAIDEAMGEMRIHYAGFVHPLFGKGRSDNKDGTPLIFEVRGHNLICLNDGERMARLLFYRMSKDCDPNAPRSKTYNNQELKLSGIFKPWPRKVDISDNGYVTAVEEENENAQ